MHDTSRGGNAILRTCFHRLHGSPPEREKIPPFLLFNRASQAGGRDVRLASGGDTLEQDGGIAVSVVHVEDAFSAERALR